MRIEFWGVRGSIASPGPDTAAVGGNTSCVEVLCGGARFILDAGTGIRKLGDSLLSQGPVEATLLLSHLHWDHIQGLPFFVPAYLPSTKLTIAGTANGVMSLGDALSHQMTAPVFPVRLDELGAQLRLREIKSGERFDVGEATVRVAKLNHPGGVQAFRIEHEGKSLVYATDPDTTRPNQVGDAARQHRGLARACAGHDQQRRPFMHHRLALLGVESVE
jgi:phosphoribosyl 1,2-cyclic phosphodiesterase